MKWEWGWRKGRSERKKNIFCRRKEIYKSVHFTSVAGAHKVNRKTNPIFYLSIFELKVRGKVYEGLTRGNKRNEGESEMVKGIES